VVFERSTVKSAAILAPQVMEVEQVSKWQSWLGGVGDYIAHILSTQIVITDQGVGMYAGI
jgi:hypothetical protein